MTPDGIDGRRLEVMGEREARRFEERTRRSAELLMRARRSMPNGVPMAWMAGLCDHAPIFVAGGEGASFEDVDGNRYVDFNQADLAATLGFAPPAVTEAVQRRAAEGASFLLPTEDGVVAAELLAERTDLPFWQFTGSASASNTEVIRIARVATGREKVLAFEGKYHGHIDETLVEGQGTDTRHEALGLPRSVLATTRVVPFNDLATLEAALASRDIACLVAEPMLTNVGIVFPDEGFWAEAARLARRAGTLLVIDEAHTHSFAYGGLTRAWGLAPDLLVLGKGLGSGIAFGAYGMTAELADLCVRYLDGNVAEPDGLALGGTTYGNALALAAARAALEHCLTKEAYRRTAELGRTLGKGLESVFRKHGLDWRAPAVGGRSAWVLFPELPRTAEESYRSLDRRFVETRRLFMLNRGIWEAIRTAGPALSFAHCQADVDRYIDVADAFLGELRDGR
ncbi:MAG: aminotransferase class III-fold pyridoxal phosphate-dependent enzyme [Rhodospirillales bacterium]|nr:aminotransferase class III-fold pyridoxal phosphate-dependent enzyme [Rhodospirillales bacterium]MDH3910795.1 aminotransferase class III-fold pyridoxal phosphate-dependent enzyme [Rhodospirillales bacterium]MDH3916867.1 aminotransferase class III-fold pyridoxal phosphate-dependent enzyme [Rhodospirillales bacterium]MDH3968435.1 aminotransferase class III-fold pyridoxal phosphate-dependent enzyme [Rhodospirillales bacterium]